MGGPFQKHSIVNNRELSADADSWTWLTVIGVIADVKEDGFNFRIDRPAWCLPYAPQSASTAALNLVVRTSGDPAAGLPGTCRPLPSF